jgi:hypothetical protein
VVFYHFCVSKSVVKMTITASTPVPTQDRRANRQSDLTARLEALTVAYMRDEIDVKTYRQRLRDINTRLDLRKIASKLQKAKSD